jgi:hypothetical protein
MATEKKDKVATDRHGQTQTESFLKLSEGLGGSVVKSGFEEHAKA